MTRRVIIDGNSASPFRVSVAGVDAASAEFNDLIFDGNQSPLRLWATGYMAIIGITYNNFLAGQNLSTDHTGSFSTTSGTFPVFMTMWRNTGDALNRIFTPSFQPANNASVLGGGGGGVCGGVFKGFNANRGLATAPDNPASTEYINYCVFRNTN
jgi:hypothetical protein